MNDAKAISMINYYDIYKESGLGFHDFIATIEADIINGELKNNKTLSAVSRVLKIHRTSMYYKIKTNKGINHTFRMHYARDASGKFNRGCRGLVTTPGQDTGNPIVASTR